MKYISLHLRVSCQDDIRQTVLDLLADAAGEAGCDSFETTSDGINGYAVKGNFNREVFSAQLMSFPVSGVKISYTIEDADDQDWNETWEDAGFSPIIIDDRIVVYDARHTTTDEAEAFTQPCRIGIEARNAFGTGTHETTQMVLQTLAQSDLKGLRVLDCGCGTGILSIAALKLGAKEATGYDIDEWSVENAIHNAGLNGVTDFKGLLGDATVLQSISEHFDIVVANINRNILLNDLQAMVLKMDTGSRMIISGFYETDCPLLTTKALSLGLRESGRKTQNSWCCLSFIKD